MYSINGLQTVFDVLAYTVSAMKESGYVQGEIEDYIYDAVKDNCNLICIEVSKEKLEDCNNVCRQVNGHSCNNDWFEDTWRDHYYSSLWDDDGRYNKSSFDDDEDTYDFLTGKEKSHMWDDDNVIDDIESKDEEAYEGFSSCKNYLWDCTDDKMLDYYDSMKRDDNGEPSYDPLNDPEAMDDF